MAHGEREQRIVAGLRGMIFEIVALLVQAVSVYREVLPEVTSNLDELSEAKIEHFRQLGYDMAIELTVAARTLARGREIFNQYLPEDERPEVIVPLLRALAESCVMMSALGDINRLPELMLTSQQLDQALAHPRFRVFVAAQRRLAAQP
jgi:hypothetical protein